MGTGNGTKRRSSGTASSVGKGKHEKEIHYSQHEGTIPNLSYYDPDGMKEKEKKELERWHADQVEREVDFDFQEELKEYCKSDVALMKAAYEWLTNPCKVSEKETLGKEKWHILLIVIL